MRFYNKQHQYYCGIDLHAKTMFICLLDKDGEILLHKNLKTDENSFLQAISPYRENLVVAVECIFTWYWLADLCVRENIDFALGHALYMKAIHGSKTKNDKVDAHKIALLVKSGMLPKAYVYPREKRATRDLLRRRNHLVNKRSQLLSHIQNTVSQYNLPPIGKNISRKSNRTGITEHFDDQTIRKSIEMDLGLINCYDQQLQEVELYISQQAKLHDVNSYYRIRSIPGVGKILTLVILYEIDDIERFTTVRDFASYSRLIRPVKESAGKSYGYSNKKIGNQHLKWAFSEAACLFLRANPQGQKYFNRLETRHGKARALSILSHKLGRTVYYLLKKKEAFDMNKFIN